LDELVDGYAALTETYGGATPELIDGTPRNVTPRVYGILDFRRGSVASYFEVPDDVIEVWCGDWKTSVSDPNTRWVETNRERFTVGPPAGEPSFQRLLVRRVLAAIRQRL
jgi:hypothetical protein